MVVRDARIVDGTGAPAFDGDIEEKSDAVVVTKSGIVTRVPRNSVASVTYADDWQRQFNDRLKKLDPTLAAQLDNIIAGRVIDATKQKIEQKIPKVPRIPF